VDNTYPTTQRVSEGALMRGAALVIDIVLLAIVGFIINTIVGDTIGGCVSFIIGIVYWVGMPVYQGGTVGKMVLGLEIVKENGDRVDLGASAIRYLLYIVDFFPYIIPGLVGALTISSSPTKQRVGDRVAKTLVVKKGSVGAGSSAPAQRF
jgi:uncharacterized RDD family membrane protein YckC